MLAAYAGLGEGVQTVSCSQTVSRLTHVLVPFLFPNPFAAYTGSGSRTCLRLTQVPAPKRFCGLHGFLFPSVRKGVISDATMSRLMERRGMAERPHGFRSSFRDWVAETTNTPHDVAETCLGHTVGGSVERAYRRTDFLEQRRALMERWANCLLEKPNVVVCLDVRAK